MFVLNSRLIKVYESENATGYLVGPAKMLKSRRQRVLANAKNPRIAVPFWVVIVSLVFSFWFLPIQYLNPASVGWVFTRLPHLTDGSGHAIQAMVFGQEPWHWPPGQLVSFGGPFGASLIYGAVSPVLAIPAKLLETLGLIGPFWQFIGIQAVLGICLSGLALYFLGRALGASEIASGTAALLCLPLPNLFVLAVFNESLSWQFLGIIPMILLLNDKCPSQRLWPWPAVMGLAIWGNSYFVPMILAFFVVHLWVIRLRYNTRLYDLLKQSLVVVLVAVVLQYLGGGFLLPMRQLGSSIEVMNTFSVDLADFFHPLYDRQGYVYRGLTVLALLLAWPCAVLVQRTVWPDVAGRGKDAAPRGLANRIVDLLVKAFWRSTARLFTGSEASGLGRALAALAPQVKGDQAEGLAKTTFTPTLFTAAALFVLALGPIIHFGTAGHFRSPVSELLLQPIVMFRAIGRFSCPLMYLLLGIAALAIDALVKTIPATGERRRFILMAFCLVLVVSQFVEMYPELTRFRNVSREQAAQVLSPNPALDVAVATSSEIEFIPVADDPAGAPWPFLAYYAIKYKVPIYSYHWLARYNSDEIGRMRKLSTMTAVECRWTTDRVYALKRSFLPQIAHCNYQMDEVVATYPDWVVLKLKQPGRAIYDPVRNETPRLMPSGSLQELLGKYLQTTARNVSDANWRNGIWIASKAGMFHVPDTDEVGQKIARGDTLTFAKSGIRRVVGFGRSSSSPTIAIEVAGGSLDPEGDGYPNPIKYQVWRDVTGINQTLRSK